MRDSWKLNTRLIPFRPHVAHGPLGFLPGSTFVVPCVPCWPWALFAHLAHLTAALAPCKAETVTIHHDTHPSHPAPILPISVSLHLTPHSSIFPSFPSAASPPARATGNRAPHSHSSLSSLRTLLICTRCTPREEPSLPVHPLGCIQAPHSAHFPSTRQATDTRQTCKKSSMG